ncbi:MAG: L-aspartate oxidase [Planctomycetota bacterium]
MTVQLSPEGRYLLDFDTRHLPHYAVDVLVVGGGIAGMQAALAAADAGASVLLLAKGPPEQTNTAWAQGGVAVAVDPSDSAESHAADTERTGCGLADPAVVTPVTEQAPAALEELIARGANFDRDENGALSLGQEGAHSHRRVVHARGDATGREMIRALCAAVDEHAGIRTHDAFLIDVLTKDGVCVGALLRETDGRLAAAFAGSTVLAAGGAGRLYRETSNTRESTGDGVAAAFRAGAEVRDAEFVQFHPTTLYLAGSPRVLVTEAVRGEGAYVIDDRGERFLPEIHPDAELAPRDVVSRAIVEHLARDDVRDIFLDLRHFPEGKVQARFPGLFQTCAQHDLDPSRDLVPVRPAAHYFIGGVAVDLDGRSTVPGLFACGEVSCTGLHGANRLASNSLLEGLVLGARTGRAAAADRRARFDGAIAHRAGRDFVTLRIDIEDLRKSLISRMWRCVGILREADGLAESAAAIESWRRFVAHVPHFGRAGFELDNLLLLGALVTAAATLREESRGTHARLDFSARNDERFLGRFGWRANQKPEFIPMETVRVGRDR